MEYKIENIKITAKSYKDYSSFFLLTKEDILKKLEQHIAYAMEEEFLYKIQRNDNAGKEYVRILNSLKQKIEKIAIMPLHNDKEFWSYRIISTEEDVALYLAKIDSIRFKETFFDGFAYASELQKIIIAEPRYISLEEYSQRNNQKLVTSRQQIRRGYLRSVHREAIQVNLGNKLTWYISELCTILNVKTIIDKPAYYAIKEDITDINEDIAEFFIEKPELIKISRKAYSSSNLRYNIKVYKNGEIISDAYYNEIIKEKLEIFLLGNKNVKAASLLKDDTLIEGHLIEEIL